MGNMFINIRLLILAKKERKNNTSGQIIYCTTYSAVCCNVCAVNNHCTNIYLDYEQLIIIQTTDFSEYNLSNQLCIIHVGINWVTDNSWSWSAYMTTKIGALNQTAHLKEVIFVALALLIVKFVIKVKQHKVIHLTWNY